MQRTILLVTAGLLAAVSPSRAASSGIELLVRNAPPHGVVVAHVDFTALLQSSGAGPVTPGKAQAALPDGKSVPFQFVPDNDFDGQKHVAGTIVLDWRGGGDGRIRVTFDGKPPEASDWKGTVQTKYVEVSHDVHKLGGLPNRILFRQSQKAIEGFIWSDRLFDPAQGSFYFGYDPTPKLEVISAGPVCTVVRVSARYTGSGRKKAASEPNAVYDWFYFSSLPLIYVQSALHQEKTFAWKEHHVLQLTFTGEKSGRWMGGEPLQQGEFTLSGKSLALRDWAAVRNGENTVAVVNSGDVLVHDGGGTFGCFLHPHNETAWKPWSETDTRISTWFWLGSETEIAAAVQAIRAQLPTRAAVSVEDQKTAAR